MNNVNLICPVKDSNNITEINCLDEINILSSEPDTESKLILEEIFNEMYEEVENTDLLTNESPEVIFAKFLWIIKIKADAIEKINATVEKLIQDIEMWKERKTQQHNGQIDFLSARMEGFLRQKQLKSLQLPSGTIGLRKQQPKIEIVDSDKFYENADDSILRRIPESIEPNLKAIKEKLKATGEIPIGIDITEQDSKFYYKFN